MNKNYVNRYSWQAVGWFILGLACLFALMQGWRYLEKPNLQQKDEIIANSLDEASALFINKQHELAAKANEIAHKLQSVDLQDSSLSLYNIFQDYSDLWGMILVKEHKPVVWYGYSLGLLPFKDTKDTVNHIAIERQNNVIYWLAQRTISKQTGQQKKDVYQLFVAERIVQTNALKIGQSQEYNFLKETGTKNGYPVSISLLEPAPDTLQAYRVLRNTKGDSVGVVYAVLGHIDQLQQNWKEANKTWQSLFAIFCCIAFLVFFTFWIEHDLFWVNLAIRLFFVFCGWFVFITVSISTRWLPDLLSNVSAEVLTSYQALCQFGINALFLFLFAFTIHRLFGQASNKGHRFGKMVSLLGSLIIGFISTLLIFAGINRASTLILNTSFPLMNLQIIPPVGTVLLYLVLGLMLWGLSLLLLNISRFIFRNSRHNFKQLWAFLWFGLILAFIFIYYLLGDVLPWWKYCTIIFFYGFICGYSFIYFKRKVIINHSSTLRNVAIASFFIAITGTFIIYFNLLNNKDEELIEIAQLYSQQKDTFARDLLKNLLLKLHHRFQPIATKDSTGGIEAIFKQVIGQSLSEKSGLYKLHFQLITDENEKLATYSNALAVPDWVNYYNPIQFYSTTSVQGINKNFVIPIIQQPDLINQDAYKTFYRGWIPLFVPAKIKPVGWIVGSVYKKRVNYKNPFQAVLASYNNMSQLNASIVQQYNDNRLVSTIYIGAGSYFPIYNRLPAKITQSVDSLTFYNLKSDKYLYRDLVVKKGEQSYLKVSVILPGIQNVLFTLFRFHLALILFGFIVSLLFQFISSGKVVFLNRNIQFRYRILDSFLLATLGFLIVLIIGTYYTLNRQNKNLVEQQLYETLTSMQLASRQVPQNNRTTERAITLTSGQMQDAFNADVSFYNNKVVVNSTAPQIYSQHLLPAVMPFPVYYELYFNQKRKAIQPVNLFGRQLFIGYRLFYDDGEPIAAIGIPAFAKSPIYQGWLLETSSLLVLFYVIVFGLFIVGAIFISHQLTQPLYEIRQGLYRISKGDLDQTILVKSKDEIGILASSYNRMAVKLKKLQTELAKSEREAGWKEIAREAAHEIKNPLTPMKLNVQHLRLQATSGKASSDELRKKIIQVTKNMLLQIDSLNTIAYNFLTYSASKRNEFKPVNIHEIITQITTLHRHSGTKKVGQDLAKLPAIVMGDKDELNSAILNLVKNAYEAAPKGSVIKIKTYKQGDYLCISVNNKGEPIPKETQNNIFSPDFSTKTGGSGLGLTICKKVVTLHDGEISVVSNREEGTTFTIKLPLEIG